MQVRVFLVGASRSGTTLVQRCLAAHPRIRSVPETDFFGKAIGGWTGKLWARLGRVRVQRAERALAALARALDRPAVASPAIGMAGIPFVALVEAFVAELDAVADADYASVWVEKTPKHFRYAGLIERTVPGARFLHVVRDGREVVASIVDRARRYPEQFGRQQDPQYGVRLWNAAVTQAAQRQHHPHHRIVGYEDFVDNPEASLRGLCEFLELDYEHAMLKSHDASGIVTQVEGWKAGASLPIARQPSRFQEVLSEDDQVRVLRGLDWARYVRLFPHRAPWETTDA